MGQYYLPYVKRGNKIKVFDNKVSGDWNGLKLMEHSYWGNAFVGNVVNELYYNKCNVCWVGDYYDEDNYAQVNCDDKQLIARIGKRVWGDNAKLEPSTLENNKGLENTLIVNHTKHEYINCNEYFKANKWVETWEGKQYDWCINPLPLLTCSASHSGGSYYGINREECGTWFNDEIEVVDDADETDLIRSGFVKQEFRFAE